MTLAEYLKEAQKTQRAFGAELEPPVTQGLVYQWLRGETRITLHYALEIEKKTAGLVRPQDCDDMFTGPASRAA